MSTMHAVSPTAYSGNYNDRSQHKGLLLTFRYFVLFEGEEVKRHFPGGTDNFLDLARLAFFAARMIVPMGGRVRSGFYAETERFFIGVHHVNKYSAIYCIPKTYTSRGVTREYKIEREVRAGFKRLIEGLGRVDGINVEHIFYMPSTRVSVKPLRRANWMGAELPGAASTTS